MDSSREIVSWHAQLHAVMLLDRPLIREIFLAHPSYQHASVVRPQQLADNISELAPSGMSTHVSIYATMLDNAAKAWQHHGL